tara:strand:+ start:628 stop:3300 length:2673 start_codon:yes stop_codon:yes gene_type:complete
MKNKFLILISIIACNLLIFLPLKSDEKFNFDVTEIEIKEKGNIIEGNKKGLVTTNDGIYIYADYFRYNKSLNTLNAKGNVKIIDKVKNFTFFSSEIVYLKEKEIIFSNSSSKAISDNLSITSDKFKYNKFSNILNTKGNVKLIDTEKDIIILANEINYFEKENKIISSGYTNGVFEKKYDFTSEDVTLNRNLMELSSNKTSIILDDNFNFYKVKKFKFFYDKKLLNAENIELETNYKKEKNDKFYFTSAIVDFQNQTFISKNTKVLLHKNMLDKERSGEPDKIKNFLNKNDPRIYAVSSSGNETRVELEKAIFTSCQKNDSCPAWSIKANKITHDKVKKELIYDNAILNVYDIPVFYFPKFFHPDPTVERRSGFLQPRLNNSNVLGTSLNVPYFHVISDNKDMTFKPTIFDNRIYMLQNEFRQENKNSSFIADFGLVKGYKSSISNNRNSINHLFSKFNLDLDLKDYLYSKFDFFIERTNNDTFLKVFQNVLLTSKDFENDLLDQNNLTSGFDLNLEHENFELTTGFRAYENLQKLNNDRYQYVLPYYDYSTTLYENIYGSFDFISSGKNTLQNTNNLRTRVTNNANYISTNFYTNTGFINNFGVYAKNFNSTGKNDEEFDSDVQSKVLNIFNFQTEIPFTKSDTNYINYLKPKLSLRINPSGMDNYSTKDRSITADNIFDIDRLGISDSYEGGKSITLGIDYKKEDIDDSEKYLEFKLASSLRDKLNNNIPSSTTLNNKTSNIFGSFESSFSEFLTFNYDFSVDNNLKSVDYNSISAEISVNNFVTEFNFIEKNNEIGDMNSIENTTSIKFDENNNLLFKTRRNRKISLTEYYDFIYEYQNDCLTAAVKYRKTYYQDRDLKPKEDLFFTLTLFPLTTLDQKVDQSLYRD